MKFSVDWAQSSGHTMEDCNMVTETDGRNGAGPAYEFSFYYIDDKTSLENEPVYIDKDDRFIQDYRFDVSKLEPSAAQVEKLIPRSLGKLALIRLSIQVFLFACIALEEMLTVINLRYASLSQTGIFLTGCALKIHRSTHLT
ncbi:3-isopropylmalate dehydratase large subunit, chloroplastic-like isoform X6 [Phalaenopsis equestris]|uniref:3-isopropylmalate dehydratase large subunit, chloroplastic-like isoform X6 n=1 Tax=Phalaenopsis equestris TaxID=78828 RepID=UPI0009E24415|nr:3-isopropylmalate dehydratase large subunit, chloroplastic-like isoform X6 [Phalaenopsis equestris]